jgi:hypothetical protein
MACCRYAGEGLLPAAPIVLGGSIEEGMGAAMGDYAKLASIAQMGLAAAIGAPGIPTDAIEKLGSATARAAEPIVSLCLYLCSEEPDIAGMLPKMPARPAHRSPVRVKGGEKTFAADSPSIWGAGWRLGAILRKAREEAKSPEAKEVLEGNEGRRGPAPHIRRAHWHTFWTGPKSGGPRKPALKWIPPIPVAFGEVEPGALPAVVHRVST